jgi:hypothetical protein
LSKQSNFKTSEQGISVEENICASIGSVTLFRGLSRAETLPANNLRALAPRFRLNWQE